MIMISVVREGLKMRNKYNLLIMILTIFIYSCSSYHFTVKHVGDKDKVEIENCSSLMTNTIAEHWKPNINSYTNTAVLNKSE